MAADPQQLEALVRESGLSYRITPRSFVFGCPLCGKPDKLYILRNTGRFVCWVCKEGDRKFSGAPEFALHELTGQSLEDLRRRLYGGGAVAAGPYLDLTFGDFDEDVDVEPELTPTRWDYHCLPLDHPHAVKGAEYLVSRGIPVELAMAYDVRYSPRERSVAFPVWVQDILVGWQYRIVYPEHGLNADAMPVHHLKTKNEGENFRDRCVMFSNRLDSVQHAVLCEGPVDALKAHLVGGNVASMGKAVSLGQVRRLLQAGVRRLYLALDPDAAVEVDPLLDKFGDVPVHLVEVPAPYEDLGQMPLDAARDAILAAPLLLRGRMHVYFPEPTIVV